MISAIIILSFLIFFHELGHFLMARLVGVRVEVFSIGFGKKLVCKECKGTKWCISAIPLGGYVQMKGQDDTNPALKSTDPDSYSSKSPWQRILILLGGPGFNFLLAFLIYLFVAFVGIEKLAPVVGKVLPNTPAYGVFKKGDKILEINGVKIKTWDEIPKVIENKDILKIKVRRDNKILTLTVKPKIESIKNMFNEEVKRKIIGIMPSGEVIKVKYTGLKAIEFAYEKFLDASMLILKGLKALITGAVGLNTLSGPVGIVDVTAKVAHYGIVPLLMLTALLSVNLGILNLLPIPALDGGHIVFNLYEAMVKKELSEEVMIKLTIAGWVFLIGLMIIGFYNDLQRILGG
ncbi:MAG: RIP metalloprotease RseP [Nautiliaceae bacterium]